LEKASWNCVNKILISEKRKSMTIITNPSITDCPKDVQPLVAEYLTIQDLSRCTRVSQAWQNLFSSDIMWKPIAKKFDIQKEEINSIHKFVIEKTNIVNYLPNFLKNQLLNDYKSLTYQKLSYYQKNYPEFLKVFDGITAIRRLPATEITDNLINNKTRHLNSKYFTSPIVRAILKNNYISYEIEFILLRIRNNATGEIYRDAISFGSSGGKRYFRTVFTAPHNRVICPMNFSSTSATVTEEKLNRLQRLIQGKPVGIITELEWDRIVEGDKTIDNGKSTLELY
jgi:hypothetical protein